LEDAEIKKMVREVRSNQSFPQSEAETRLAVLESFECWDTFFLLLEEMIRTNSQSKEYLIRKATVQGISLGDVSAAAKTCQTIVSRFRMSYQDFISLVAGVVVGQEQWENEAILLRAVAHSFPESQCKIACLERLCFIYERKTSDESELARSFAEILELDPANVKALRFFKLIHMRNREWEEVARSLITLIEVSFRKHEVYRYAQELATVYLYHLNEPEAAVDCLNRHCAGSPLDDSAIRLEAYFNLGRWLDCLNVIEGQIPRIEEHTSLAVAYYRKGILHEKLGDLGMADHCYVQALEYQPSYLEAFERRIGVSINKSSWADVCQQLNCLITMTRDIDLQEILRETTTRIESLISGAASHDLAVKQS
jgi:tetratricopeptide (TPR) repeat protein